MDSPTPPLSEKPKKRQRPTESDSNDSPTTKRPRYRNAEQKAHENDLKKKSKKYQRGPAPDLQSIPNTRHRLKAMQKHQKSKKAAELTARSELLLQEGDGFLEPDEGQKTWEVTQQEIKESVNAVASNKIFELHLNDFGPYRLDYSRDGQFLLLAGERGHVSLMNWQKSDLMTELHLKETVYDAKFLHNETMFAVAQKKYTYVYDCKGTEIHCLRKHLNPTHLEFLPYHFLLVTYGNKKLQYQDISTGQYITGITTQSHCQAMKQNPYNAIIHMGQNNGVVSLYSPNMKDPVASILCHAGPIKDLAIDKSGHTMVTAGLDGHVFVWDVRTYQKLQDYAAPSKHAIQSLDISQKGHLAMGYGIHTQIWTNYSQKRATEPYMSYTLKDKRRDIISSVRFCPYEDILGVGYTCGFNSIGIPGSGHANFDTYVADVFSTNKKRKEATVHRLLQKIPADMIVLDPSKIGNVATDISANQHLELQKEAFEESAPEGKKWSEARKVAKQKKKMGGKEKIGKRLAKKEQTHHEKSKMLLAESLRKQEKQKVEEDIEAGPRPALSRFAPKKG